MNVMNLFSACC